MGERDWDKVLAEHKRVAEESRVRINRLIASRDPNRPRRFAEKKTKLCYDIQLGDYEINNLKDRLEKLYARRVGLVEEVRKLEADYENGEPTI